MESKTKIAIVSVIVIVVIVAAAVAIFAGGNEDKYEPPTSGDIGSGVIYGNVDGNSVIDSTDLETIQRIISGELDFADYPLADANLDGTVDEDDVAIVQAVIDGENTTLSVVDVNDEIVPVSYPVTNYAFTSGTNMKSIIAVLGLYDSISAIAIDTETLSPALDSGLSAAIDSGKVKTLTEDSQKLTTESINILVDEGVRLVIGEDTGMTSDSEIVAAMEQLGITFLPMNTKDKDLQINAINTLGILLGCEDRAGSYSSWIQQICDEITDNEGDRAGTVTVLSVVMTNSVSGTSSDYYAATTLAGGKNLADWEKSTQKFNKGDTWLLDAKYDADYIFHFRTVTYPDGLSDEEIANYASYFENTSTYQDGGYYLINGSLPLPVRLAVMAETMYSDCFEEGWAESVFQEYVTEFLGVDYNVSQGIYIWNA